ncbi:selenoprotein T-like [Scleropages formosus]|uniref:Selenoprotein T n=1 Tax=Scleropages formosus TaxID=113540 RepID=A0A0P7U621_SCLFO|nr:selenoprotein T-like [Scleropages formosus]
MERFRWPRFSACLLFVGLPLIGLLLACGASADSGGVKRLKMQFATGPLLKFQIWYIASFLSIFKFAVIGLIILGKDPFGFFGMQAPGLWVWGQENKIYACMMVFFLSNMIENQCMSTGAFEITFNDVPVWSKLQSGHLPSMQQLVQILDNEMKMNVHMDALPHQRS